MALFPPTSQAAAAYQQGHEVAKKCLGDQHPLTLGAQGSILGTVLFVKTRSLLLVAKPLESGFCLKIGYFHIKWLRLGAKCSIFRHGQRQLRQTLAKNANAVREHRAPTGQRNFHQILR